MRFRTKLVLSYIVLIALMTGSFYLYFDHTLQQGMIEESRANLVSQTRLARMLVMSNKQATAPQQLAESIGTVIKARVTLIAPNGTVLGDSDVGQARLAQLENHLQRPEVQESLINGSGSAVRYSDTLRTKMLYSAMTYGNGTVDGIIRLAMPLEYLASARNALHGMVGGASALTILIALLFSYVLSNLTTKPLRDMADAAAGIGHGTAKTKIPVVSNDEIGMLAGVLNDMSERIDDQVQRLSAEKQRLDTILSSMGEGIMVTAPDGVITLVNPAFCRLFSISGSVDGKKLVEISRHPDLLEAFNDLGKPDVDELVREISIQPNDITLLTHWVPLNVDGVRQGIVAVFHDISDLKKAENMRRDFVANVSHELRTPVTIIKGYAETLLDGALKSDPDRAVRFVEIISSHSERLTNLINDILTLSSLETKEALIELNPIDVSGTIAKACMLLQERAVQKNIAILNESAAVALPRIMADQGRLEQVVVNLLENAIKYTPEGGSIRLFAEDDGDFVKVSVADTGIGIPFKDLPRIFERFYRVDEARTREQGGTGLGLAIVKHIVQLHGGAVSVTSEPGKGSIFTFTAKKA
ncbi:MAG: ATP-binding protein [Desulfuromonadaceae bacterium]|nr:ATP-binding protein [Desulfuromonadaceae bacterium]MDD2848867.1 ATP-binding protein [Desulfuromonadaceae bacterium]MDD4132176.1 ATP-binding protein [Desulfuromonadaceae bacterium]